MPPDRLYCPWCMKPCAVPECPTCGALPRSAEDVALGPERDAPLVGTALDDRYRVTRFIARGGMGSVYKGYDSILGRMVAIKFLGARDGATPDPRLYRRFKQEAMLMARLGSSHTVAFLDFDGRHDGCPYIVMELLRGWTVADVLAAKGPMSAVEVALRFRPVCEVLDAAHRRGIVHRDIKPPNIFLHRLDDGTEVVKVLDFGISKVLATTARRSLLPTPRYVYGTVEYMSPQQLAGKPASAADDLYALGCVLYESLTGGAPFEGDPDAVAARHAIGTPEPIAPGPDRPRALCDLVTRLLSKSPSDRPASAAVVEGVLTALLGSRPRA